MSLTTHQQIYELIKTSQRPLIVFRQNFNGDSLGSALALFLLLKKMDKTADLAAADFSWTKNFSFLPQEKILPSLNNLKKFIIDLSLKNAQMDELSYEVIAKEKLAISITPKNGAFKADQVSFRESDFKYDLILTVDAPDLELLGGLYRDNADFFYRTPLINFDHNPANENYGQINLVELTAASTAEVIYDLMESLSGDFLDEKIATCLLTGIIAKTRSFRSPNVTPKTLNVAGRLVAGGADRETIIHNLYRTKNLATLKLWGRALARLENDPSLNLAWSVVSQQDFLAAGADEENLWEVVDELIINSPEAEIVVLFYEQKNQQICCLITGRKESDINVLTKIFGPKTSHNLIRFSIADKTILQAKAETVGQIRKILQDRKQGKIV